MLKLFILRHAQAAGSYDVDDHERPLTPHGIEQAKNVAASLPTINLALCSSAKRTRMTLEGVQQGGATLQKVIHSNDIYNGSAGDLLTAIQSCNKEETLLIIAHNPGIHQLANLLSAENENTLRENLRYAYAPATLSVLECPIENWKNIQPHANKLIDLIVAT